MKTVSDEFVAHARTFTTSSGSEFDHPDIEGVMFGHDGSGSLAVIMWGRNPKNKIMLDSSLLRFDIDGRYTVMLGRMLTVKEDISYHVLKYVKELANE